MSSSVFDSVLTAPPKCVAIVEDDEALRSALAFALSVEGYMPLTYSNAEELLNAPPLAGPACLIVDLFLPGIDGLDLLDVLKNEHGDWPAVLITSHPGQKIRRRAGRLGAAILEKPLMADDVTSLVRELIGAARAPT